MAVKDWSPKRREQFAWCCRRLREPPYSYSYEDIVWHLADANGNPQAEPWEVYALANPGKSEAQVKAWRARHCPASG